jgi:hypothetical protein
MNIYESDEYYMPVMNIIYGCDDICDLCEYLRLLEKKKKKRKNSSRRAKVTALGEEPFFNESQIFGSRRRSGTHS